MKIHTFILIFSLLISQTACDSSPMNSSEDNTIKPDKLSEIIQEVRFICYTPTQFDPNPNHQIIPTKESIRIDLEVLRPYFDGLITYGLNEGLEQIPAIAEEMEYRAMFLGIWDIQSETEVNKAINLAKEHPKLIVAICCGNEGLLTNRYDFQTLETVMGQIRQLLPSIYVVTSEPIHDYGNDDLRRLGDFHFPIIHPFFSGVDKSDPVAAANWVFGRVEALRSYSQKPILVKESGLPSAGHPDCSPQRQATFWRTLFSKGTGTPNVGYAAFEAFDLPWKARDTGTEIEGHWGFWDANRQPKPVVDALKKIRTNNNKSK
jgi:exo-beta-1,3-glucanase (GH17 family)